MDKITVLRKILKSARLYTKNLENKNMLFIYNDINKKSQCIEAVFEPRHFQHLTCVKIKDGSL